MDCQNRIKIAHDQEIPCGHHASDELPNGRPVCSCCMMLGPLLEQVNEHIQQRLEEAAAMGRTSGIISIKASRGQVVSSHIFPETN